MARRWVIAGGGTGGHVTPALALGEALAQRGDEVLFVGSSRGLESRLVPAAGFKLEMLPSEQFMGRSWLGRLRSILSILVSVVRALLIMRNFKADAVLSVGGYAAMPSALAAWLSRRPLFLVEPNAIPGRVNRITSRLASMVFVGFGETRSALPSRVPSRCVGVPLRRALYEAFAKDRKSGMPSVPLRIFVFGGSQGARQLNDNVPEALARLAKNSIEVFHQTGEADRDAVQARYAELGIKAEVVAFETNMPNRYRWADLAICRAGALTVAELTLAGVPALLVPYPFAADNHQKANANALEAAGAARCLAADPLDLTALAQGVAEFVTSPNRLVLMRESAVRLARPHAADEIIDACAAILNRGQANSIDQREDPSCNES
jgi:UDP-N-acetylglucosamine--N-acetylmuramyl-(pentapeptide) pyrophosphoryl-undecaprenol N-acetylglucosamine transferase